MRTAPDLSTRRRLAVRWIIAKGFPLDFWRGCGIGLQARTPDSRSGSFWTGFDRLSPADPASQRRLRSLLRSAPPARRSRRIVSAFRASLRSPWRGSSGVPGMTLALHSGANDNPPPRGRQCFFLEKDFTFQVVDSQHPAACFRFDGCSGALRMFRRVRNGSARIRLPLAAMAASPQTPVVDPADSPAWETRGPWVAQKGPLC